MGAEPALDRALGVVGDYLHHQAMAPRPLVQSQAQGLEVQGRRQIAQILNAVGRQVIGLFQPDEKFVPAEAGFPAVPVQAENLAVHGLLHGQMTVVMQTAGRPPVEMPAPLRAQGREGRLFHK